MQRLMLVGIILPKRLKKKAEVMEAKGAEINKGGLIVVVNGVRGFVPSNQFGKNWSVSFKPARQVL